MSDDATTGFFYQPPAADLLAEARDWLAHATVGIAGLGLMGGSLGMALRGVGGEKRLCAHVLGWSRNTATMDEALALGCVDELVPSFAELAAKVDLLILGTPARAIASQIAQAGKLLQPGALLIDLGSTKKQIVDVMSTLPAGVLAVGVHPMCGKDTGGPGASDPLLYNNKVFVLSPADNSTTTAHARTWALAEALNSRPTPIEAARHDKLVALISHVPFLAAAGVVGAAEEVAAGDDLVWQLAASGFRDTTRVAGGQIDMMVDILLTNSGAVEAGLVALQAKLALLQALIAQGDEAGLREELGKAQTRRRQLFQ